MFRRDRLAKNARHVDAGKAHIGSGDDDDRNVASAGVRGDFLLDGESIQRWQDQIEDDEVGRPLFENEQGRRSIVRFNDVVAGETKSGAIHPSYRGIVFNDENGLALHSASS